MSTIHLNDKVAIVTGASRGIGESIAKTFAKEGAKVVLASRKIDGLEAVKAAIVEDGGDATAIACHTGDQAQIDALVKQTVDTYGKVDILVNNAATNPYFGPALGVEKAAWDKTFDVNVRGYFELTRAVANHLMERDAPGSIVNVSSVLGLLGGRFQAVYAMTKAAVISQTKTLAIELGPQKIRVNAIAPGFIATKFSKAIVESDMMRDAILMRTPLGRIGDPEDIAPLALFLASDASSFVTGATYVADGGLTVE